MAMDVMLQFVHSFSRVPSLRESIASVRKKGVATVALSTFISVLIVVLQVTGTVDFKLEKNNCWIGQFYFALGFYFIPSIIVYLFCFVCLCILLRSIGKKKNAAKQNLRKRESRNNVLLKIYVKLMLILGIIEIVGLVQVRHSNLTENESIFNATFGLIYDILRSLRGVFIFVVYMVK